MSRRHPEPEPEPDVAAAGAVKPSPYSQAGGLAPADPAEAGGSGQSEEVVASADSGTTAAEPETKPSDPDVKPGAGNRPAKSAPKQTLAGRVWVAIAVVAILLVLVIIFIAENTRSITISFVGLHGHISEALALLIAIIVGVVITLLVGSARIIQLSLEVRRHRRKLKGLGEL